MYKKVNSHGHFCTVLLLVQTCYNWLKHQQPHYIQMNAIFNRPQPQQPTPPKPEYPDEEPSYLKEEESHLFEKTMYKIGVGYLYGLHNI